ncbi:MAG: amidophosphoribosyltransferase [Spirochaetales bacterium]|nr:amidophosphoribosyltransferase [Spirochaetales bacterium]
MKSDRLGHYCGVVGIYSAEKVNIPEWLYYALFSLQHRGQESAGIVYNKNNEKLVMYKDLGMVSQVLGKYLAAEHPSHIGIGHVRYSTHGGNRLENAQPIVVNCNKGRIALAHNGNLSNNDVLKQELVDEGSIFQSTSDTELILHMIARSRKPSFDLALTETLNRLEGAFSITLIHNQTLYAVRDRQGFRPLYIGTKDGHTVIASETCALEILKVHEYREVQPGEIVKINASGSSSNIFAASESTSHCVFEQIYFARPDSEVFGTPVYDMRKKMGAALAQIETHEGDIVVPVPDSGNTAALGYAEEAGLPFEMGLTRSHYAGRSFIMPRIDQRELMVRMKLAPVKSLIKGKRIILIDDSLVRGTTSKILIGLLREAGAREVHLRLSSPELKWPCFFGIDIPTRKELISNHHTPEQIARIVGADSLKFLPIDALFEVLGTRTRHCFACFNGEYPVPVPPIPDIDG